MSVVRITCDRIDRSRDLNIIVLSGLPLKLLQYIKTHLFCLLLQFYIYRSIFGENALANLSIEKPVDDPDSKVTGHIRIRAKSQVNLSFI